MSVENKSHLTEGRRYKIAYLVSHPIQYQAPLLRFISTQPDFDLTVFFRSDHSIGDFYDDGFDKTIHWDVSLLDGYRHEFLPALGRTDRLGLLRPINYGIVRRLWAGQFDALWVHGYVPWFNWIAMAAARAAGIRTMVRDEASSLSKSRSTLKTILKRHLFFRLLNRATDAFLAIGTLNGNYYIENGIPREKIFSSPYCVDNWYFRNLAEAALADKERLRSELGLLPGRPVILYASKLQRRKRADDLLTAFAKLVDRDWASGKPYLLFAGDGEQRTELETAARPLGEDVRFLGFRNQSELPALFGLCDVFVLPSLAEPWGLVVNEVMSAGRPVIVSDEVGCWPDLVRDGVNGYVFPAGNADALAACLEQLLADEALRASMGRAGWDIIDQWDFRRVVAGLREALAAITR
jgi:glycosyltransferase involved in cell wall biosynthesis